MSASAPSAVAGGLAKRVGRRLLGPGVWSRLQDARARVRWYRALARRPTRRYLRRNGRQVKAGPFAGMTYPSSVVPAAPQLVARLIGTYELELHGPLERIFATVPDRIVDIGTAEGYYAVGAALRCPKALVIGFESDPYLARACARLAQANDVSDRVTIEGVCDIHALAALDVAAGGLVICDVDGLESELIDPERVPWLVHAHCVIETHDPIAPGTTALLTDRLSRTHDVDRLATEPRYVSSHGQLLAGADLLAADQNLLLSECRPWPQGWIVAMPKEAG